MPNRSSRDLISQVQFIAAQVYCQFAEPGCDLGYSGSTVRRPVVQRREEQGGDDTHQYAETSDQSISDDSDFFIERGQLCRY